MSNYFRDRQRAKYLKEAKAFRVRADIDVAYANLKMEYDRLSETLEMPGPVEVHINSDLTELVVQLSETIKSLGRQNANLRKELKDQGKELDWWRQVE